MKIYLSVSRAERGDSLPSASSPVAQIAFSHAFSMQLVISVVKPRMCESVRESSENAIPLFSWFFEKVLAIAAGCATFTVYALCVLS